jgi:hypothetical protein
MKFTDSDDSGSQLREDSQNWFSRVASVRAISRMDKDAEVELGNQAG